MGVTNHIDAHIRYIISMVVGLCLLLFADISKATSTDCKAEKTSIEKDICQNPVLLSNANKTDEYYQYILNLTPQEQLQKTIKEQKVWLKKREQICQKELEDITNCLNELMENRILELQNQLTEKQIKFEQIILTLPNSPKNAAIQLRQYTQSELASAWLVYLAHFMPQSGLTEREEEKHFDIAANIGGDTYPQDILRDMKSDSKVSKDELVLTLLRMQLETEPYNKIKNAHCFLFSKHNEVAYTAFGPLYGSSRDSLSPICTPYGDLFKQTAWLNLKATFKNYISDTYYHGGTMIHSYLNAFSIAELRATLSPQDFLNPTNKFDFDYKRYPFLWNRKNFSNIINDAKRQTSEWLIKNHSMTNVNAKIAAQNIVDRWIQSRVNLIDELFYYKEDNTKEGSNEYSGLEGLNQLYKIHHQSPHF